MKQLAYVYGKTAKELCDKVNKLGVEPLSVVTAGAGERSIAYYYAAAPKAEAKKPEPAKEEAPKAEEAKAEAPKAEAKKPVAKK